MNSKTGSPVAAANSTSSEVVRVRVLQVTGPFIIRVDPEHPAGEVDTSRSTLERFLNKKQFGMLIGISVAIVTQMHASSEEQKIISLGLIATIMAVYVMEHWVMKCKVIILGIAINFAKILCFYLLPCILQPEWLIWHGFVVVFICATAYTFSAELKIKIAWCYNQSVLVMNKALNPECNDQATFVSGAPRVNNNTV